MLYLVLITLKTNESETITNDYVVELKMKKLALKLTVFLSFILAGAGFAQTTTIDFETAGAGYTPSTTSGTGFTDVFNRDNSDLPSCTNETGFFWSVEDLPVSNPSIAIDQIDVTGSTAFTFSIDMVAHHFDDWDDNDELLITYSIDGGASQNLMWVQNAGGTFNQPASLDTDFDGDGDCGAGTLPALTTGTDVCTVSSSDFQTFTSASIALSGNSTLDITLQFNGLDATDEGIYIDNIVITETAPAGCNISASGLSGTSCNDNSTVPTATDDYITFDLNPTGSNLAATYNVSVSSGTISPTSASFGSATTFTLNNGSAGGGDVTVTITDATDGSCTLDQVITDPGSCSSSCTTFFSDDFSGTLAQWSNNADWAISGGVMDHNISGSAGSSYNYANMASQNLASAEYEWNVCINTSQGTWDPSGSNHFAYWLISDATNILSGTGNGYAVGVNQTGTSDMLTLYRVDAGVYTAIITSTFDWNASDDVCVRVTRNTSGDWELLYDPNGTGEVSGGTVTDATHTSGTYTGVNFTYSSTRAGLFDIDNVSICSGAPACTPTHTITSFAPTSGPEMTEITVTGTGFTASTTADFSGIAATVTYVSATTLIVEVPTGANDGPFTLTESACPLDASGSFTVISTSGTCGGALFSDIIISEVYDEASGSLGYIEIFNGTGATVDLTTYTIDRYGTIGGTTPTHTYTFPASGVGSSIAHNQVLYGRVSTSANVATPDFDFGGTTAGFNDDDRLELMNGGSIVDDFHDGTVGVVGYVYQRSTGITGPNATWTAGEWTTVAAGTTSDLGTYSVSFDTPPSVTDEPDDLFACSITESITATAGSGGGALTYQWLYNDGSAAGWSNVTAAAFPLATVAGETSANLSITGASTDIENYDGYQFYCLVTEGGSCNAASDAAQFLARSEDDPEMITALINGCEPGGGCGSEGYNEFFALEIGSVAVDVTDASNVNVNYSATYPATTTYGDSYTADASLTADFNTDAGCALFTDAVTAGTIPAHSTVLVMSSNVCATAYDFSSLCGSGPIYLLYSTDGSWGSTGNFANSGAGSRYFSVSITDVNGTTTSTEYNYDPNSLSDTDGDYAEFEYCGPAAYNYGNDACSVRSITLPAELLYFDAYRKDNVAELVWETGSEINNDKFTIMRSGDGEAFYPIGEVQGQGNSTVINHYSFTDEQPLSGDNFYRLHQYDFDGAMNPSDVKWLEFNAEFSFNGYSNGEEIILEYQDILPNSEVEIYTIEGKLVDSFTLNDVKGEYRLNLPTQSYYLVRLTNQYESKIIRIIH
jgi:hypothetical protein